MTRQRIASSTARPSRETTEVRPRSGNWTAADKLAILKEYESYPHGDARRGELLRRKGLYTSHISKWRAQRNRGALASLTSQPPGRRPQLLDPHADELAQLQREVARLKDQLAKAETIIEIQKKVALLLGEVKPPPASTDS